MMGRRFFFRAFLPAFLVIASVVIGTLGFYEHFHMVDTANGAPAKSELKRWGDAFFYGVGLPIMQTVAIRDNSESMPLMLEVARVLGVIAFVYAVGLAVLSAIWRHLVLWWWGVLHRLGLAKFPGHAVVCGLGWKGRQLAEDLRRLQYRVAVVERDEENGFLPWCAANGVSVVHGDASERETLRVARAGTAERVYVVCNNDDICLRAARSVAGLVRHSNRAHAVQCAVNFQSAAMPPLLRHAVAPVRLGSGKVERLRVRSFIMEDSTARMLFARHPLDEFPSGMKPGVSARLHIFGDSLLGQALLVQALRLCVFPEGIAFAPALHCRDAQGALADFCARFPCFRADTTSRTAVPVEPWGRETLPSVRFYEMPFSDADLLKDDSPLFAANDGDHLHAVAALDDGPLSASLISSVAPKLGRAAEEKGFAANAFYYFNSPDKEYRENLERSLDATIPGVRIKAFTDFLEGCTVAAVDARPLDDLARLLNFHYAAPERYRQSEGKETLSIAEELWADGASEEDREFSRSGADHLAVKVRSLDFSWNQLFEVADSKASGELDVLSQLESAIAKESVALGRLEHRRWCADHLLSGFRYGPVKRKVEKEHPCLVPWEELPLVKDDRTADNPNFYQEQACRMSSVIPRLVRDIRGVRTKKNWRYPKPLESGK